MLKAKDVISKVINIVCTVIIVLAVVILVSVVFSRGERPNFMGYSAFRVLTGSMEPAIKTDSFVLVKNAGPEDIKEGDIITFYSSDPALGGAVNTHRVTEIVTADDGSISFVTRGDNNLIDDKYPVTAQALIGKVVMVSHFLGVLVRLIVNPLVFVPVIAIPLIVLLIVNVRNVFRTIKLSEQQQEEEALEQALEEVRRRRALQEEAEAQAVDNADQESSTTE